VRNHPISVAAIEVMTVTAAIVTVGTEAMIAAVFVAARRGDFRVADLR
jgi:hypothetical protein